MGEHRRSFAAHMLALETELNAQGIDVVFDPFRPGEGATYTRSLDQPIRLMVRSSDLERAREVARSMEIERELAGE